MYVIDMEREDDCDDFDIVSERDPIGAQLANWITVNDIDMSLSPQIVQQI